MKNNLFRRRVAVVGISCMLCLFIAVGCSPRVASSDPYSDNLASQTSFIWSPRTDCTQCHAAEAASFEDDTCLAATHRAQGTDCSICHTDESALSSAHDGVSVGTVATVKKLAKTAVEDKACLSCHGSYEDLAAKTVGVTTLTDSNSMIVNPHTVAGLNADHRTSTNCGSCHSMHSTDAPDTTAPAYCSSCHHAGIYQCHTCHE